MKFRIVMWASAGFLVAASSALYFAMRSKDNPIEPIVYVGCLTSQLCLSVLMSISACLFIWLFLRMPLPMRWSARSWKHCGKS